MPTPGDILSDLASEFELLDGLEGRYAHLIDLGKALPALPDGDRTEENRVRGCASQVWVVTRAEGDRLHIRGDSDAHIVRGLVALVLRLLDGQRRADIAQFDMSRAMAQLGLAGALSQQRANGLASLVARVRQAAVAP